MDVLNLLNQYWVVVLFVGGMVGNWYVIKNQMRIFELRLKHLESNSDSRNEKDAESRAKLMVIETMLNNLNANLSEVKNDVREVAKRQTQAAA